MTESSPSLKYNDYSAEIVADSISEAGHRLISVEVTMARFVLAELNTHRQFSRNSASSRAIPLLKQLNRILDKPYIPRQWGENIAGMSSNEVLPAEEAATADRIWQQALGYAALCASNLIGGLDNLKDADCQQAIEAAVGKNFDYSQVEVLKNSKVHKQFVNRLLEPFMHHTVLITATEWANFFGLRIDSHAQPEIRRAAELIKEAIDNSQPQSLVEGQWHLPYIDPALKETYADRPEILKKVAVARSARLSYLNQQKHQESLAQGQSLEKIVEQDIQLFENLVNNGHMSPLEHAATPFTEADWQNIRRLQADLSKGHYLIKEIEFHANFRGWHQYRKSIPLEYNFSLRKNQDFSS